MVVRMKTYPSKPVRFREFVSSFISLLVHLSNSEALSIHTCSSHSEYSIRRYYYHCYYCVCSAYIELSI